MLLSDVTEIIWPKEPVKGSKEKRIGDAIEIKREDSEYEIGQIRSILLVVENRRWRLLFV